MSEHLPDFTKEIPSGSTFILTEPVTNVEKELYCAALKAISNPKVSNVIWLCYQKVPRDVTRILTECGGTPESINKIHFVDMLSNMLGLDQKYENTSYCPSPTEYNCVLRSIDNVNSGNGQNNILVFDNINALMSYDIIERMLRFIRNINNLITGSCPIVYLGISGGSNQEVEISICSAMDNVYYLQETSIIPGHQKPWVKLKKTSWSDVFSLNTPLLFVLLIIMIGVNLMMFALVILLVIMNQGGL